jgi:hypothetical protein
MSYFAKVRDGKVVTVISAEEEFFNSFVDDSPGEWIQTSYHTHGGEHQLGGTPLRKNFAGIGFTYDVNRDAFIPPKQFESWVLNEGTCLWEAPVPYPQDDKNYYWDESSLSWIEYVEVE